MEDRINKKIKAALAALKEQKEALATIALQWDDFDTKYKSFCSILASQEQQLSSVEVNYTSVHHMTEIRIKLQVVTSAGTGIQPSLLPTN